MTTPSVRGIVLDFDGVLARTMEQHAEAYRRTLAPLGVPVADGDVFLREGARSETILRDLAEAAGKPVGIDQVRDLADHKQSVFRELGPVALYEGARELVLALDRPGIKLGLVTGTRRENLEYVMPNLLPKFQVVLAQDSYTHDKPHPEPYEKAAAGLGLAPEVCAALENAVRGVQSAKTAGYARVVGLATTMPKAVLATAGADLVVTSHEEAAAALLGLASK